MSLQSLVDTVLIPILEMTAILSVGIIEWFIKLFKPDYFLWFDWMDRMD